MRETFTDVRFREGSRAIIETAEAICAEYAAQGYSLTLRQVYYQFVSRDLLPNNDKSYKRLGSIINDARLAGLFDWSYIEDRTRNVQGGFGGYRSPGQYLDRLVSGYVEPIWEGQDFRPEVWVEKEALADVISQAARKRRVPTFSCRGYVSQSEMYAAAKRFERRRSDGQEPIVIHLGDHDPSGIDMTRDIHDRLSLMAYGDIVVRRIALNMDQIRQYNPPPNPAKLSDSRGTDYVERFGNQSWELDALEPRVLDELIVSTLDEYIDHTIMNEKIDAEQANEDRLRVVSDRWDDLEANWAEVLDVIDN